MLEAKMGAILLHQKSPIMQFGTFTILALPIILPIYPQNTLYEY